MPKVSNVFSGSLDGMGSPYASRSQETLEQMINRIGSGRDNLPGGINIVARPLMHYRDSMTVTCKHWEHQGRSIRLFVNPSNMQWNLPRRGTVVKTAAGAVRNVWRNRYKGTYYDEGTVAITFQTGNIMPSTAYDNSELRSPEDAQRAIATPRTPPGLHNFYDFLELLDEPMLLGASENQHMIIHTSRVFPRMMMYGFFTEDSMSFTEAATDGNRLEWQATFQIYRTVPRFQRRSDLVASYNEMVYRDEQIGNDTVSRVAAHEKQMAAAKDEAAMNNVLANAEAVKPKTVTTSSDTKKIIATAGQKSSQQTTGQITTPWLRDVMGLND